MSVARSCLLILFAALALPAQQQTQQPVASDKPLPPVVISTSFAGGTMSEFVARIRSAEPKANIIVASSAAVAKVPPVELRGAELELALEGACAARYRAHRGTGARRPHGHRPLGHDAVISVSPLSVLVGARGRTPLRRTDGSEATAAR
jgi:hypothetical protein